MVESGLFYGTFVDPALKTMRRRIAGKIKPGEKVIDIACGTGAQVFEFAGIASKSVGVDLSESMINWAKKAKSKKEIKSTEFYVADAMNLSMFGKREFDVANLSLALHQFDPDLHSKILGEMKRVANKVLVFDYAVPSPKNYIGYGTKFAEFLAGKIHNRNFKHYCNLGGLEKILPENKLRIESSETFGQNTFQLAICVSE